MSAQYDRRGNQNSTSPSEKSKPQPRNTAPGSFLANIRQIADHNSSHENGSRNFYHGDQCIDLVDDDEVHSIGHNSTKKTKSPALMSSESDSPSSSPPMAGQEQEREEVSSNKYPVYKRDISRGQERVKLPLVNSSNLMIKPPNILYISTNMVHKDAHVDFSVSRISDEDCCSSCLGDCLASELPCWCASETGGEFAYTPEGLLKAEFLDKCVAMNKSPETKHYYYCEKVCPLSNDLSKKGKRVKACKGHLSRKFIKECWIKCGCSKRCGNRVVQKGIRVLLQVFATSAEKGWGVRSTTALKKGTFICEYIGEIVTNQELYERNKERAAKNEVHTYPVLLDADWGSERILKDEEALCLDATEFGNVGRFINHRCEDANLIEMPVEVESPDHHYYHVAFFTVRDVEAMEELTWDYGIEFDDIYHPIKAFKCKCGSKLCRDKNRASPQSFPKKLKVNGK